MKRYHVTTFGCQMNAHDSERIKGLLESLGIGEATAPDEADVVVFNTCTIREKPDTRLAAYLGDAGARKRENPELVIAVGGCYAEAQRERIFELYPFVDVAFGPGSIPHLGDWVGAGGSGVARGRFGTHEHFAGHLPVHRERPFQAWVQVSMGCNSKCAYCIVPAVRGREQSRRPGDILAEVEQLGARRCAGAHAARPERELLGSRSGAGRRDRVRRAPPRLRRGRRDRAHPIHEPAPEGLPGPRGRCARGVRRRLRARPPAAAVGLGAGAEGDAPNVHAGPLPALWSGVCEARFPTSRSGRT